jgi:hypothetical protein
MKYLIAKLHSWQKWIKVVGQILPMLALIFATGCVVSHPSASTVQSWPSPPPAGYSMLMLYWPQTRWGQAGGGPSVYIDDVKAFKLHINHYTWIYVRSGQHTFSTVWGSKIFGWNPVSDLNMNKAISLEDGKSYYLRLRNWTSDFSMNPVYTSEKINVAINHVSEQTARKEAGTCWFTKPFVEQIDGALKRP